MQGFNHLLDNKRLWLTVCIPATFAFALIYFFSSNCKCYVWYIITVLSGLAVVVEICKLIAKKLNKNNDNLDTNFHAFMESLYSNLSPKRDNTTIMRITVDWFYTLLPAFILHEEDSSVFNGLLDFYIKKENVHTISYELIKNLNLCWGIKRGVYLHILKIFNKLNIVGNMNANSEYQKFLVLYLSSISRYGFIDTHSVRLLEEKDFKIIGDDEKLNYLIFDSLMEKLQNLKQNVTESVRKDIDTMISFVEKNKKWSILKTK